MTRRTPPPATRASTERAGRYRDRIFDDRRHDPYQSTGKPGGTVRCTDCGLVHSDGRWHAGVAPESAAAGRCPACRRIHDGMPAGWLVLDGPFVAAHRDEITRIARNEAAREQAEHPLHRIIGLADRGDAIEITTTDIHLPQRIGAAVKHACHGELDVRYGEDEYSVRVHWSR